MIRVDKSEQRLSIEGTKRDIMEEFTILVEELKKELGEKDLQFAYDLGIKDDNEKAELVANLILDKLNKMIESYKENKKEED